MKTRLTISSTLLVAAMATAHRASANDTHAASVGADDDNPDTSGQPTNGEETGAAVDLLGATVPDPTGPYALGRSEMYGVRTSFHERVARRWGIDFGMAGSLAPHRYDLAWDIPDFLVYMTPRWRMQLYTVTGIELRVSHFESDTNTIFSGVFGIGVEMRMSDATAMRFDVRGLLPINRPDDAPYAPRAVASLGLVFF